MPQDCLSEGSMLASWKLAEEESCFDKYFFPRSTKSDDFVITNFPIKIGTRVKRMELPKDFDFREKIITAMRTTGLT